MKPRLLLLFVLICSSFCCFTQTYPVRTITTVSAPYPVSLAQFADDESGKVNLTIIPSDSKMQDYPVKLRLFISGNGFKIYSDPNFISKTVNINYGETQTLSGSELKAWFNPDNLIFEGYSKNQYLKSGQLPEGLVQVWFEAWDYYRNFNISGATRSMLWLFQNNPPSLNFPADKKEFPYADPQNITFNWSSGQSPFTVAGATNEYKFELWEIWPDNLNPDEVALNSRPLYSNAQSSTTLVYGTDCPILQTGRRYAWRVTAFDPEGKKQYKNNGYSAVRSFRFGRDCGIPDFKLEKVTTGKAIFSWENDDRYTGYTLRYCNAGRKTAKWYEQTGSATGATISGLSPATKYEVQLQGTCYEQEGGYSSSLYVQTPQALTYTCGASSTDISSANKEPLSVLLHNDYFKASDFDVQVEEAKGENGVFSGNGYVRVPLLNFVKFNAHFSNISINSSYRMTRGSVILDYNQANGLMADVTSILMNLGISSGGGQTTFSDILPSKVSVDTSITSISVDTVAKTVIVTTVDGKTAGPGNTAGEGGLVAISNSIPGSTQYVADTKDGTVYSGSTSSGTTQPKAGNKALNYTVSFAAHKNQDYGFDMPDDKHPAGNYKTEKIGGSMVNVPWKSVAENAADRIIAGVGGTGADTAVHFISASGNMVMTAAGSSQNCSNTSVLSGYSAIKQVLVAGTRNNDQVRAWYYQNDTTQKAVKVDTTKTDSVRKVITSSRILAGAVNLAAYDKEVLSLCLVQLNNTAIPDVSNVEDQLNRIYAPAVEQWKVSSLKLDLSETGKISIIPADKSMNYTSDEIRINSAIKKSSNYDPNTFYLIFTNKYTPSGIGGYMPFNQKFGYICMGSQSMDHLMKDIAHELGHGAFRLRHPFDKKNAYVQDSLSTQNLMDYNMGTELLKYQWDECHQWHLGVNWFEEGEEAASIMNSDLLCISEDNVKYFKNKIFYDPDGKIIDIKDAIPFGFFSQNEKADSLRGRLAAFKLNEKLYFTSYKNAKFYGYVPVDTKDIDKDKLSFDEVKSSEVQTVTGNSNNCSVQISIGGNVIATFNQINCAECKGLPVTKTIYSYTSLPVKEADLSRLFDGKNSITEDDGSVYHSQKAVLFITDDSTIDAHKAEIEGYNAPVGYTKIWLHKGKSGWEIKSKLPEAIADFFTLKDANGVPFYTNTAGYLSTDITVEDAAKLVYEFFDFIGKARIHDCVWDCNNEKYDPKYVTVYSYITSPLKSITTSLTQIGNDKWNDVLGDDSVVHAAGFSPLRDKQVEFAFICGIWNGLVSVPGSLSDLLRLASSFLTEKSDLTVFIENLKAHQAELGCSNILCVLRKQLAKQLDGKCKIAEFGGEAGFLIAISVLDPEALESLLGKVATSAIKTIRYVNDLTGKLDPAQWAFSLTTKGIGLIKNSAGKVFASIDYGKFRCKVLKGGTVTELEADVKNVALETNAEGKLVARTESGNFEVEEGEVSEVEKIETPEDAGQQKVTNEGKTGDELGAAAKGVDELENFLIQQSKIKESLSILESKNLTSKFAGASEVQAASIHRYTVSSFELNGKLNKGLSLTEYETKWFQSIKKGLGAMRNSKKYVGNVFRGQTLDESIVLEKYVNPFKQAKDLGTQAIVEEKALLSCTKDNSVADYFIQLSKNKIKDGETGVLVKFTIKSKRGVDIDAISDYGKNLCSGNPKCKKIQQEILLENGTFKINDVQKTTDNGITHYEIYLEEF